MAESNNPKEVVTKDPPGVVAVYVHHNRVLAYAACFETSTPGGFRLLEAQKIRAKERLAVEVVKALASPTLYEGLRSHDFNRLMQSMTGTVKLIPVGHGDEADDD